MQNLSVINEKKQKTEMFLSYTILCQLCHIHQRNQIKTKLTQLRIYFNVACQVNITKKASTKRGHLIPQVQNTEVKLSMKPCIVLTKIVSKELGEK